MWTSPRQHSTSQQSQTFILEVMWLWEIGHYPCFPGGSDSKEFACNAGDLGLIPGLGRSFRKRNRYSFQDSCLKNSMHRRAWRTTVHGITESLVFLFAMQRSGESMSSKPGKSDWISSLLDMSEEQVPLGNPALSISGLGARQKTMWPCRRKMRVKELGYLMISLLWYFHFPLLWNCMNNLSYLCWQLISTHKKHNDVICW